MKLFNLISKKQVRLKGDVSVIPQKEFSELLSAKELIDKIKEEGVEHRAEIAKEGEAIFKEAKENGFKEGMELWSAQIKLLEKERQKVRGEIEKVISKVASVTVKKLIGRELKQNPKTIIDIVAKNLKAVTSHKKITIFANKKDLKHFSENREELKRIIEDLESFVVQPRDDITEGGAIIETEAGIIDVRVESMWSTIERTFEDLFSK